VQSGFVLHEELERIESDFNEVVVERTGDRVDLVVQGAVYASYHPRLFLTGYSWDGLTAAALLRPGGPPGSVLVLGLGGGTVCRQLRAALPDAELSAIEIDAAIVKAARDHMAVDSLDVDVVVDDAYHFLRNSERRWDVVIDDIYLTGPDDVERPFAVAGEALETLRARVKPGGLVVANLIVDDGHHREVRAATRRAFRDAFQVVRVVRPPRGLNEILVGGDGVLNARTLKGFAEAYPDPLDASLWSKIRTASLSR
jgi:predicted membrane-bound spermidine synthase